MTLVVVVVAGDTMHSGKFEAANTQSAVPAAADASGIAMVFRSIHICHTQNIRIFTSSPFMLLELIYTLKFMQRPLLSLPFHNSLPLRCGHHIWTLPSAAY